MKKIIYVIGIIFLLVVISVNVLFTSKLSSSERITINLNNIVYSICTILLAVIIYLITKKANEKLKKDDSESKIRKRLFIIALVIYFILNILWIFSVRPGIGGDSVHVGNIAQVFYKESNSELLNNKTYAGITLKEYMQEYPQQIPLSFVYSIIFRIIFFDEIGVLRIVNVISAVLIVVAIYKITKQLSKQYKTNTILPLILILTFVPLIMLTTFIYGDIPSLALCLFAVYFTMKYIESKKYKFIIIATILTSIANMMRMNSLIFVIATTIYLMLNTIKEFNKKEIKKTGISIGIIIIYILIAIIPSTIIENCYFKKYNLDKNKVYPKSSFILMSMEESWRGNGWYNEKIAEPALKQEANIKEKYNEKIKERINYLSKNIDYTFDFYTKKITSMWSENTYSSFFNNKINDKEVLKKGKDAIMFYQKASLLLITASSLIIIIQNRKKLSLEIIFLLTIFIGGFAFHILWEAKSRYIIPYIVILMPITAVEINKFKIFKKDK